VRARLGDALIATANDPCLESWLAYMGSAAALSRANPDFYVLNLDIGGGTTNLALGRGGEVLRTGCLFVGARHVQVEPGGYRIVRLSRYADALLNHLKIERKVGEEMTPIHVEAVLTWYLDLLDAAIAGRREHFEEPTARLHEQVPYRPLDRTAFVVTLSGGVGELVYRALDGKPLPPTTAFGDLGIDLAQRLLQSHWVDDFRRYRPASCGRATVYGLLRHNTEISGSTLYLPHPEMLPLADVPILGSITPSTNAEEMRYLFMLAGRCDPGGCVRVQVGSHDAGDVEMIGQRIAAALQESAFPLQRTLVLLVQENVGKALGHYATHWGTLPNRVIVIDEVTLRFVRYARIGAPRQQVVPVSYFGLHDEQ
jgi:ethanolamine utilization protein EutA